MAIEVTALVPDVIFSTLNGSELPEDFSERFHDSDFWMAREQLHRAVRAVRFFHSKGYKVHLNFDLD